MSEKIAKEIIAKMRRSKRGAVVRYENGKFNVAIEGSANYDKWLNKRDVIGVYKESVNLDFVLADIEWVTK